MILDLEEVLQFLYGGLTILCLAIGVFFLRYWSTHRDRLFAWFTIAFWAFAVSWGVHMLVHRPSESAPLIYLFRLLGFSVIIIGIVEKNRRGTS